MLKRFLGMAAPSRTLGIPKDEVLTVLRFPVTFVARRHETPSGQENWDLQHEDP
jgi:hypothetical protein